MLAILLMYAKTQSQDSHSKVTSVLARHLHRAKERLAEDRKYLMQGLGRIKSTLQ